MTPTLWEVARRPRWVGALVLALLIAAIFAMLGQWQVSRAIEQGQKDERDTETAVTLESVAEPQSPLLSEAGGRIVEIQATIDPESLIVLEGREQDGVSGAWLTARAVTESGASLAVALGWAPSASAALEAQRTVAGGPQVILGRYMPSEAPTEADFEHDSTEAMSVSALINEWPGFSGDVYAGYVIVDTPAPGLTAIVSLPPEQQTELNWLNVFYAIEWAVFALFAFYLWFRLVQDVREREAEAAEEAVAAQASPGSSD